jgi:hypothetical protein
MNTSGWKRREATHFVKRVFSTTCIDYYIPIIASTIAAATILASLTKGRHVMYRLSIVLLASLCMLFAGYSAAQTAPAVRIQPLQIRKAPAVNPAAIRITPLVIAPIADPEAQVQAEMKREQDKRDDISTALAKVSANYSKLTFTPAIGNSCVDPDTTWNPRSGESFVCVGRTTCIGRSSRWSKNRINPCEPGVTIDKCVHSNECKADSLCDVGRQTCVPR